MIEMGIAPGAGRMSGAAPDALVRRLVGSDAPEPREAQRRLCDVHAERKSEHVELQALFGGDDHAEQSVERELDARSAGARRLPT